MSSANPRRKNGHRRTELRKRVKARGEPCHLCLLDIDYSLPYLHPDAFVLDEIVPVAAGATEEEKARLAQDPQNVAPAHRHCNQERGAMPMEQWWRYRKLIEQGVGQKEARSKSRTIQGSAATPIPSLADQFPTTRAW